MGKDNKFIFYFKIQVEYKIDKEQRGGGGKKYYNLYYVLEIEDIKFWLGRYCVLFFCSN